MVSSPPHVPGSGKDPLVARIERLERAVANVSNKTLFSASIGSGGITIDGGTLFIENGGDIQLSAGGHIRDGSGNILFSADGTNGERLSTPFLAVPMVPLWNGGSIRGGTDGIGEYLITASHVLTETVLWRGWIPQVLHPNIMWQGVVGRASGTTSTPTYRLYVAGQLVTQWSQTTFGSFNTSQQDITDLTAFGVPFAEVTVSIQADTTSTDQLALTTDAVVMAGQ